MKKIFAIALALVMVLSMASAFAFCASGTYDWACATDVCNFGKAKVEVVPYVATNACDGKGVEYVESTCAGAVYGQKVFYAIKLTVPADINAEWFAKATLTVEEKGLKDSTFDALAASHPVLGAIETDDDFGEKEMVWYVYNVEGDGLATWFVKNAADADFSLSSVIMSAEVDEAKNAKVCATLTSEYYPITVKTAPSDDKYVEVNKWDVTYREKDSNLVFDIFDGTTWKYSAAIVHFNAEDKVEWVASDYDGTEKFVAWDGDKLVKEDGTRVGTSCGNAAKVAEVLKYFNIDFNTCITQKAVKANFGWKDEVKSCATYSANATAVVDAECVVSIPKTGDKSVLAWLF